MSYEVIGILTGRHLVDPLPFRHRRWCTKSVTTIGKCSGLITTIVIDLTITGGELPAASLDTDRRIAKTRTAVTGRRNALGRGTPPSGLILVGTWPLVSFKDCTVPAVASKIAQR